MKNYTMPTRADNTKTLMQLFPPRKTKITWNAVGQYNIKHTPALGFYTRLARIVLLSLTVAAIGGFLAWAANTGAKKSLEQVNLDAARYCQQYGECS